MSNTIRITKDGASSVARRLLEHKNTHWRNLKKKFENEVKAICKSRIPPEILELSKKEEFQDWLSWSSSAYINSHGFNRETIYFEGSLPSHTNSHHRPELTKEEAKFLIKSFNNYEKAEAQYKKLVNEVERALLSLSTYKKITESFPEAVKFLPIKYAPPAINYDLLRAKINQQQTV